MKAHKDLRGKSLFFLLFLWFLWFINFSARMVFVPILPIIEDEFMISHAQAGSIFMFQAVGYGLALILAGLYGGRIGYKNSILICLGISFATFCLIPFIKVFSVLYIFCFTTGFAVGLYLPSAIPLITNYFAKEEWPKSIAIHDSASSIAIFCTPFIVLFLLHFVKWRGVFGVLAVVFLICGFIFFFAVDNVKVKYSQKAIFFDIMKTGVFWVQSVLWALAGGAILGVYFMAPLYLTKELSMSIEYANSLNGISRLGPAFLAMAAGIFIDRVNLRKAIALVMLVSGILTILLGLVPVKLVGLLMILQAIAIIGFFPMGLVMIAKSFDTETRGMATALILTVNAVFGWGISPYLLGLAGDHIGFGLGFVLLGIVVSLSGFLPLCLKETNREKT